MDPACWPNFGDLKETGLDGLARLEAVIREISDPGLVMQRVVDQALVLIASADGAVVELVDGGRLVYACAAGTLVSHVGLRLDMAGSLSGLAVRQGEILCCEDAAVDPRVDGDACRAVGAVSMVCVPLGRGSRRIGALKVSAARAQAFDGQAVAILGRLAEFISIAIDAVSELSRVAEELLQLPSGEVGAGLGAGSELAGGAGGSRLEIGEFMAGVLRPGMLADLTVRRRVEGVLSERGFWLLCQPIVDVASGALVGVEALSRFGGLPVQPPDVWFTEAQAVGLGVPLQLAAVEAALGTLAGLRAPAFLSMNVDAEAIVATELRDLLDVGPPERIVLELTEHLRIEDYPQLRAVLRDLRGQGVRLAIDDTGAGFSSLAHIVHLAPDLIKLDRQFTRGIDLDPVRRALATALVTFASDTGAQVIAEGIETVGELETVRELGIPWGQGYFIAPPAPLDSLPESYPHVAAGPGRRAFDLPVVAGSG